MDITKIKFPDNTITNIKDAALTNRVSEMDEILGSSLNDLNGRVEAIKEVIPSSASASNKVVTQSDIANFITKSVNDLTNYYTKSQTYTQTEVNSLIGAINQFKYEIYASTSTVTSPQSNVLYLIGPTGSGSDKYEEYVYPNSTTGWTKIGDTTIDLSDYVTTSALNTALADYTTTTDLTTLLAGTDHQTAASDHTLAGTDHQTAAGDHTTASNDHTTAGNDHTTAGNDHTRAESDHTRAESDHAVVEGYNTRLTNVEGEVSQLGQALSSEMGSVRFSRLGFLDETNINPTTGDDAYNAKVISSSIYTPINGSVIYINDKSQVAGRSLRYAVAYYDASKNFIERTDVSTATIYSVPQGAKFFRIAISLYINGQSVGGHKQDYDLENVFSYDNASLKAYLDDLDEQVHDLAEGDALVEIISFTLGGYINTENSTINVNDGVPVATTSSSYRYAVVPCSPGDSFVINAKATRVQAPWCFVDASFNVINKTQIGSGTAVIIEWDNIVAPENAAWLIINDQNTGKPNYKGKTILGDARKIVSELSREIGYYDNSIFEIGNISIQPNGLNYTSNTSRARTKEGKYIHLRVGDIINFGDSAIRFYIGWFNGQGWSSQGWVTAGTYTIQYESDYVLLVRKSDNSVLASVDDGFGSFYITRANGKQDQLKSGVSIKTLNGKSILGYGNVEIGSLRNVYVKRPLRSVAHRGCHILLEPTTHHIPESSVQSFIQAAKQGFDTIECDIQYTSDGVPVIFHDMTINAVARNPDGTEISEQVSITGTSYEVLMQYDYGIKQGQEYAGTKLLTLSQAVDVCKKLGMDFMPQIKAGFTTQRAKDVIDIVAGYDMLDNCIWQGLDGVYSYLTAMYNYNNNLNFLLLAPNGITSTLINNAKAIRNANNQVYIGVDYSLLTDAMIQLCKSDNIPLMLWTVNDESYILNSISPYVCGVMSDSIAAQKLLKDNLISQAVE